MNRSSEIASRLTGFSSRLMLGTAAAALAFSANTAYAQNEQVTVTGTSIRGQQPVGANVISIDRQAIEATGAQTTAQLLATIPQLSNFGSAAQGGQNSSDTGIQAPTIHSLGNSASNSTLILIDGHRLPLTGLTHNLIDPSVIPPAALANVEVLPDGASAIYGSDAVAGVLNFHTRKDYNGWETSFQTGIADHYNSFTFSQLFGHSWENGGIVAAYNYTSRSNLMNSSRDFITARQDIRRGAISDPSQFGGMCSPPTVTTGCIAVPVTGTATAGQVSNLQTVTLSGPGVAGGVAGGIPVPYPSDGGNFQNLTSCPVATISTTNANSGSVFVYPYAGTTAIPRQTSLGNNGPGTGVCDTLNYQTALPSELRNQGLVAIRQALTERLMVNLDVVYSSKFNVDHNARGTLTNAVAYNPAGTGGPAFGTNQRNPFYVGVPGAATNATSQFISMGFDQLLAGMTPAASTKTGQQTVFATVGFDYDLGGDWLASLGGTAGNDLTFQRDQGGVNSAEALLALNGTTNVNGTANSSPASSAIQDTYQLNTTVGITRALTTANALDVWRPKDTNRTSSAVLRSLLDSAENRTSVQNFQNLTFKADGPLFDLWGAGKIKAAIGSEWIHYTQDYRDSRSNNAGPLSTSSRTANITMTRTVYAAFSEIVVPLIGADMNVPLIQTLTLDVAGRYDHYSDFGDTLNPKIAMAWGIIDGIAASASFGTSFTAPALNSIGRPSDGLSPITSVAANNSGAANNLFVAFNDTRPFNAGAGIAGTWVSTAAGCSAAGSQPSKLDSSGAVVNATAPGFTDATGCKVVNQNGTASQGLSINVGNIHLRPELGQTYSANLVFDNFGKFWDVLEGFSAQFTYYQAKFTGAVTNIGVATTATAAGLPELTTFGPLVGTGGLPGWAQTDQFILDQTVGKPQTNPLPSRIYSIQSTAQWNAFNLWQNGIDFKIDYRLSTDDYGDFTFDFSGNQILRFSQQNTTGAIIDIKDGRNGGRFTGIEFTGSLGIGWSMDPFSVRVNYRYLHPYNTGVTTFPFNLAGPNRLANQQHIGALQTIDLSMSYTLPEEWLSGTQLNINIDNVLDTVPPYQNSSNGAISNNGSIIGRLVNISLRKKW